MNVIYAKGSEGIQFNKICDEGTRYSQEKGIIKCISPLKGNLIRENNITQPLDIYHCHSAHSLYGIRRAKELGAITILQRDSCHVLDMIEWCEEGNKYWRNSFPHACSDLRARTALDFQLAEYDESDYILVASKLEEQSFINRGFNPEKIKRIPFSVDTDLFKYEGPDREFSVILNGEMSVRKGFPEALKSCIAAKVDLNIIPSSPRGPVFVKKQLELHTVCLGLTREDGFPCLSGDTLITTLRGLIPIKEVVKGDKVLTHKNRFRNVTNTMTKLKKGFYKLNFCGCETLNITEEHPLYIKERLNRKFKENKFKLSEPKWENTSNLKEYKSYGCIGVNKLEENLNNLTKTDCWILGRYVADGYTQTNKRKDRVNSYNNKVIICIGNKKVKEFIDKTKNSKYHICLSKDNSMYRVIIIDTKFRELCEECGKGAINKKVPSWIMNLPKKRLISFLDGYLSGDGYYNSQRDSWSATSISRVLIHQIQQIVFKCFNTPSIIFLNKFKEKGVILGRDVNLKQAYTIQFSKNIKLKNRIKLIDEHLSTPLVSKEYINKEINVYNLEVEEDESYMANNIVVHNCFVQECMAMGIVPILSKRNGVCELINHGKNGFIVDCSDPESAIKEVSEILKFLRDKPKWMKIMGLKARETVMKRTWADYSKDIYNLYQEVLK